MNSRAYDIKSPMLPHGLKVNVTFKKEFKAAAVRGSVPRAEAEAIYRDLVMHSLPPIAVALMVAELQRRLGPNESLLNHLPSYPHLIRALFDQRHPLHDCVLRGQRVVIEQLGNC